jgi:hypothetical protein
MYAYIRGRFREDGPGHWPWLMWAAFGLAFMTRARRRCCPLLVILVFDWLAPSPHPPRGLRHLGGIALFAAIALPWFFVVTYEHKGLLAYFLGSEVVARVASDSFARHGEWYGWAEVYVPTCRSAHCRGPCACWPGRAHCRPRSGAGARRRCAPRKRRRCCWRCGSVALAGVLRRALSPAAVPVAAFRAAGAAGGAVSRRPEPTPAALAVAGGLARRIARDPHRRRPLPSDQDASAWAQAIRTRIAPPITEVVFVEDMPRYGLHLYLGVEVETLSLDNLEEPAFNPEYDETLATELAEGATRPVSSTWSSRSCGNAVEQRVLAHGFRPRAARQSHSTAGSSSSCSGSDALQRAGFIRRSTSEPRR